MHRTWTAYVVSAVILLSVCVWNVSAAPPVFHAPPAEDGIYIQGAELVEEPPEPDSAPIPPNETETEWEWVPQLGASGIFPADPPAASEATVLTEIRDLLTVFLALAVAGIACLIVWLIIHASLRVFTRYTGL